MQAYTGTHGGAFFYAGPGNAVFYENEQGECFSVDNALSNEAFAALLTDDQLVLSLSEDTGHIQ